MSPDKSSEVPAMYTTCSKASCQGEAETRGRGKDKEEELRCSRLAKWDVIHPARVQKSVHILGVVDSPIHQKDRDVPVAFILPTTTKRHTYYMKAAAHASSA